MPLAEVIYALHMYHSNEQNFNSDINIMLRMCSDSFFRILTMFENSRYIK